MILLDTHALVWALMAPDLLSAKARDAIDTATGWGVSAASLYEIRYKHMIGKWPDVAAIAQDGLAERLTALGIDVVAASGPVMDRAGGFDWPHRDPFDRMIVATCLHSRLPLVSRDTTLDTEPSATLNRIW
ncbi:MAG: type II toxin-antitoxin system VapC family toxin [Pseudomonadota bacterium]